MLVRVPWAPELFSAPALQQVLDKYRRDRLRSVPFFDGLLSGETDALVASFSGVPAVHHPVRGWIRGEDAFRGFVGDTRSWLADRHVEVEEVNILITTPRGVEEVVLRLDGEGGRGRIGLPLAFAVDHDDNERITEMRLYFSTWPLNGRRSSCPPLPRPDPDLDGPDVVGEYRRALATGDVDAVLAAFEPDGYLREPDGDTRVHRGPAQLRTLYEHLFSDGGGIALEPCSITDDGRICALEYNTVAEGRTARSPEAGLGVYVRGASGRLAAARVYHEPDPPFDPGAPP
jgi:hypothetical protein